MIFDIAFIQNREYIFPPSYTIFIYALCVVMLLIVLKNYRDNMRKLNGEMIALLVYTFIVFSYATLYWLLR